ncbi:MAG: serine/threonine protein kinase, partial [Acidimicrobiia bacterium]|nr:serine/threonine protein kinase [Acidimicrobiia bacterium]
MGSGGSSRVYRARQSDLDRVIAVKVINAGHDPDVARRFDRERKAMGRLSNHEGIVPVYSTGVTPFGEPFLVMPYYPNGSLQDQIDRGPLDWRSAVGYVDAVAETMAAAHEEGVVHLDIKPANILLTANGAPRIADFGIAKLSSGSGVAARTTGTAFTPAYSAPETFLDGQATPAADVYGLGATLWACLVGHPPFLGPGEDTNLMAVIGRVVNNPLGDVRHLTPEPICRVINQSMAKDPLNRYRSAREFSYALQQAMAEVGIGPGARNGDAAVRPRADQAEIHQFSPPVPYGSGPEPVYSEQTRIFAEQPMAPHVTSARTISRGPSLTSPGPSPSVVAPDTGRTLLQPTADSSQYRSGPPRIVERTPLIDVDRFRFGPIVAGLVALIGVGLLAGWALTRGGSTPDSGVASVNELSPPAGPETDTESGVGGSIDLSLTASTSSTLSSTTTGP